MKNTSTILIFVLFLSACGKPSSPSNDKVDDAIAVKVMPIELVEQSAQLTKTGQLTTDDETYLSFKTGGIVSRIFVNEGDIIQSGQLLATLDMTEIRAMYEQAKLGYEKAVRDNGRAKNLYKDSVATLEQLQNSETMLSVAKQQLAAAEFNLNHSEIRAIKSGRVLRKMSSEGQMAGPGTPILLVNGSGSGKWLIKVALSDREWAAIQVGDKAFVHLESLNISKSSAHVLRKSEMADPYTGTFQVDIVLETKIENVASGMIAQVDIIPSKVSKGWQVPYDALLDANGNEAFVYVIDDKGLAKKVKVHFAQINDAQVLADSGLEYYTNLIVKGNAYLKDGSVVNIIK